MHGIFPELPKTYYQLTCDLPMYASQAEAKVQTELLTLSEAQQIAIKRSGQTQPSNILHVQMDGQFVLGWIFLMLCCGFDHVQPCRGLYLYARTLGPFYRIVIRDKDESGKVMAVSSGFTVPAMGLMHCDSLEIFTRG